MTDKFLRSVTVVCNMTKKQFPAEMQHLVGKLKEVASGMMVEACSIGGFAVEQQKAKLKNDIADFAKRISQNAFVTKLREASNKKSWREFDKVIGESLGEFFDAGVSDECKKMDQALSGAFV